MYCTECGAEIGSTVKFCSKCGAKVSQEKAQSQNKSINSVSRKSQYRRKNFNKTVSNKQYAENKNQWIALVLSLIIIGIGQFYNGDIKKGAVMLVVGVIGGVLSLGTIWFIVALYSAFDAYMVATRKIPLWI